MRKTVRQTLAATAFCLVALPLAAVAQSPAANSTPVHTQASQPNANVLPAVPVVDLKPADGTLVNLVKAELKKASDARRTPFLEIGATWCGPCKKLAASLSD